MLKKSFLLAVFVILIAAMVSTSYARGDGSLTLLGRAVSGATKSVSVQGDYAYVGASHFLLVFDISTPGSPVLTGKVSVEGDWVSVSGSYAYVIGYQLGLQIVDVSDPAQPTIVGSFPIEGFFSVTASGDYVYLGGLGGLQIVDVSDPSQPGEVAYIDMDSAPNGLVVSDGLLYASEIIGGLHVFDVSDPANPLEVGQYVTTSEEWARCVQKEGDTLYMGVTQVGNGHLRSFYILDVSDPTHPVKAGEITGEEENTIPLNASVSGHHAYLAYTSGGLDIVDVSDPGAPRKLGSYAGKVSDVSVVGEHAYVAAGDGGFQVLNVSDPTEPTLGYTYSTGDEIHAVWSVGDIIYSASGGNGLEVFDASDPANPVLIGTAIVPNAKVVDVAISEQYAYVMARTFEWTDEITRAGLFVFDISDPAHPREVGFLFRTSHSLTLYDHYVLLGGSVIVDVADPTNPVEVGRIPGPGAKDVVVSDGFCYMAAEDNGLCIADISDPANPEVLSEYMDPSFGEYEPWGGITNISVAGDYAYVVETGLDDLGLPIMEVFFGVLHILDVSDRTDPKPVGAFRLPNGLYLGLVVWNDYAFVRVLGSGIRVIDVIDPANPVEAGWYVHQFGWGSMQSGNPNSLYLSDEKVYVANHEAGLYILQMSPRLLTRRAGPTAVEEDTRIANVPSAFAMGQNFPNPFNPTTEIRYALSEAGPVRLSVFNLLGQEIRVLAEGFREPGTYRVRWDGKDGHGLEAAAGIYLVRLEAGEFSQTRRMALVK